MRTKPPRAMTTLEVLAVIAICGLLLAMILPALQAARESSRRIHCASNLREVGYALHGYLLANRVFPPALPAIDGDPRKGGNAWYSPQAQLIPYMEQRQLASEFDVRVPISPSLLGSFSGGAAPGKPERVRIDVFLCPSDPAVGRSGPGNSFRACTGPGAYAAEGSTLSPGGGLGAFTPLVPHAPSDFTDGLSATVGISEKAIGSADLVKFRMRTDFWYSGAGQFGSPLATDAMVALCGAASTWTPPSYSAFAGSTWLYAGYDNSWYNHAVSPNQPIPDCSSLPGPMSAAASIGGVFRASSYHPGGVNCLLMDGSSRFIADGIDIFVWRAASTRANHDTAPL
ncbi:MAG TPA: DUF1559 domain-containing protein [Pirellulales bacterium]|nr:DUF1559 domain-containing protein [Pirellulales bacterium]